VVVVVIDRDVVCVAVAVISDVIVVGNDDVDIVVVTDGGGVPAVVSGFLGAKITNFNTRESETTNIVTMMKQMKMIVTRRWCHHLRGLVFSLSNAL
jgi:uncharacterized protein YsxB (DUF464 family)